ncbi:MAG: iron-containing alcohol dehydrogenase [Raoultibacter sp.]
MHAFEYCCPTKIICGKDSLKKLGDEIRGRSIGCPLVLTDATLVKLGVAQQVFEALDEAGVVYKTFDKILPDSSLDIVDAVVRIYGASGCDGLIALGGGSVIDTAKGAAASLSCAGTDFARLQGSEILHDDLPPLIAIPTTAGTGSEVTLVAVVADTVAQTKLSYTSYKLVPDVAFLDPALTQSLPPKLTATTGMDALTHAIEAYTSIQKNPVSDAFALGAIKLLSPNIALACAHPQNTDARTALALGSLMAGIAFSNAMVGIVHALGHSLGGLCHVPHGQAMMLLLPHCVDYNVRQGNHRGLYGELLQTMDPKRFIETSADARDAAFAHLLYDINAYYKAEYQIPTTLAEVGVSRDQLEAVAKKARYDGAALYNEEEITLASAMEILESAFGTAEYVPQASQ